MTLSLLILIIPSERKSQVKMDKGLFFLLVGLGAMDAGIPFWLIAYGQSHLDSSIVAVMMGTIPVFTAVLQMLVGKDKKVTKWQFIGIIVSFTGLFVLINPSSDSFKGNLIGYLAILGACISFAIAFMFMERLPRHISALRASRFVLLIYSLPFLAFWFVSEGYSNFPTDNKAWLAALVLGAFSSGIVYIFYIQSVRLSGPTFTSFSNYLVPLIGALLGIFILKESFTSELMWSIILIILGLVISNKKS